MRVVVLHAHFALFAGNELEFVLGMLDIPVDMDDAGAHRRVEQRAVLQRIALRAHQLLAAGVTRDLEAHGHGELDHVARLHIQRHIAAGRARDLLAVDEDAHRLGRPARNTHLERERRGGLLHLDLHMAAVRNIGLAGQLHAAGGDVQLGLARGVDVGVDGIAAGGIEHLRQQTHKARAQRGAAGAAILPARVLAALQEVEIVEAAILDLRGQQHIVDRVFHLVHIVRVVRLEQVHPLIEQHPEVGGAQLVVVVPHAQPVAAGIIGVVLAHIDAAADVLPLVLVHPERVPDGVDVQLVARGAIQIAVALERGQQRGVRMIAGMLIDGAVIVLEQLLKPPRLAVILFAHVDIVPLADRRIVHARAHEDALEAQIHILDIGQKIAGVEIIGHGARQLERARVARIARVQQAERDPRAGVVGIFLGVELVTRDGHDEAVVVLARVDLSHDRVRLGAQLGIVHPQKRRTRAREELARRLSLQVDLEMARLPGVRHGGRRLFGMDAIVIHHAIQLEALEEGDVVLKRLAQPSAPERHAAHRRAGRIGHRIFLIHDLFLPCVIVSGV